MLRGLVALNSHRPKKGMGVSSSASLQVRFHPVVEPRPNSPAEQKRRSESVRPSLISAQSNLDLLRGWSETPWRARRNVYRYPPTLRYRRVGIYGFYNRRLYRGMSRKPGEAPGKPGEAPGKPRANPGKPGQTRMGHPKS